MKIYEILGETENTKDYTPCVFIVGGSTVWQYGLMVEDNREIYCYSRELGWIPRVDWTVSDLESHFARMRKEGFTVRELKTVCS